MRQQLIDLNEIQQIDLGIHEVEQTRATLPVKLTELEAMVSVLREDKARLLTQKEGLVAERKGLEGTVHAETHKLRKWEKRLGDIRNQREYLALSREVESSKRANRDAEARMAELATEIKGLDTQLEQLEDRLAEAEVDFETERERVDSELARLEERIANERARSEELHHKVPKSLLLKYARIRDKRGGLGLVAVVDGKCTGCNMRLPPQLYNVLQRGEKVEQCPSCQRLIFWDKLLNTEESASAEAN